MSKELIPFWEDAYQDEDVVPASEDIAPFAIGLVKDEAIKELYKDWEILQFKSYVFEDEHPNVPKHLHASNKIVARRIG